MRIVNPLHYPLAVLLGGILLVISVRLQHLPPWVMLPIATGLSTATATLLANKQSSLGEIREIQLQSRQLAAKAVQLRQQSVEVLAGNSEQLDLLTTIQYACDRATEFPPKIEQLTQRITKGDSLLSVAELDQQLKKVHKKISLSSGAAREQLQQLAASVERNKQLALQGEDTRQAQLISLSTAITETAGILQQLQNQLRSANLQDTNQIAELQSLSQELTQFQDNLDLLISS